MLKNPSKTQLFLDKTKYCLVYKKHYIYQKNNLIMKVKLFFTAMLFYCMSDFAQVQLNNGPELDNDRDNKMNRM